MTCHCGAPESSPVHHPSPTATHAFRSASVVDRIEPDKPDGFMVEHHRYDDVLNFGPFANGAEVKAWLAAHPEVRGVVVPLYRTVDWSRRPGVVGVIE